MKIEMPSMLCLCIATLTSCAPTVQSEKNNDSEPIIEQNDSELEVTDEQKALAKNFIVLHDLITQEKSDETVFNELINKNSRVVVDFYTDWCPPCRAFGPVFEHVATQERDILFIKVNIERAPNVARLHAGKSIPFVVFFKNGKQVMQKAGAQSEQRLRSLISKELR